MYIWYFAGGGVIVAIIVLVVLLFILSKEESIGDVIFLYDKIIPLKSPGILPKLEDGLRRMGILAVAVGDKLVVQDFVYWEMSEIENKGKTYLSIRAGTKTWYFILTVVLLTVYLIGVVMGALALWKFVDVKDKIKLILIEEAGDPSIANLL